MNEEAGFIAALLAEPDDQTVLLVYADWLDERGDPRAEYLRVLVEEGPHTERVAQLGAALEPNWVRLLATRAFDVGRRVRFCFAPFAPHEGEIVAISPDRFRVTVRAVLLGGRADLEAHISTVELVK
ncbi:MAG TPA: TIGR02996 domain-containing protein [Gemmata sp.]